MTGCAIVGCTRKPRTAGRTLCDYHQNRKSRLGDPLAPPLGSNNAERFWPTDDRRPGETVAEWCRRLDGYYNAPEGVPT